MSGGGARGVSLRQRALVVMLPVIMAAGLASRRWPAVLPGVVAAYAGDVLWSVMVYVLAALVWPTLPPRVIALRALAIAWTVELSQAVHLPWLDALRRHRIGALVLGQGFLWSDLLCYTGGIAVAFLLDRGWQRRARSGGANERGETR
ncbi:MAG: DUF2809 domain-containing protein [Gemmatimonadetes bacterium]|nr:DUF2809 domain-containing protein [Gemmatimonadota bacterium]